MRLSSEQVRHIISCIHQVAPAAEVYLYGSRTDDFLKGGDIDLLVLSSSEEKEELLAKQFMILNQIKKSKLVGDRKIDIIYCTPQELSTEAFLQQISETKIKL